MCVMSEHDPDGVPRVRRGRHEPNERLPISYWHCASVAGVDVDRRQRDYVNRTGNEIPGEAYANLYTVPPASAERRAYAESVEHEHLASAAKSTDAVEDVHHDADHDDRHATSHMHGLGTRFQIQIVAARATERSSTRHRLGTPAAAHLHAADRAAERAGPQVDHHVEQHDRPRRELWTPEHGRNGIVFGYAY